MKICNKKILYLIVFISISYNIWGKDAIHEKTDSLKYALSKCGEDSFRVKLLIAISNEIDCSDTLQKLYYGRSAVALAEKLGWERGEMDASYSLGTIYSYCLSEFDLSISEIEKALSIAEKLNNKNDQANILGVLGNTYIKKGDYTKAIWYFKKAVRIDCDEELRTGILGNMGDAYSDIGDYSNALNSFQEALKIIERTMADSKKAIRKDTATYGLLLVTIGDIYTASSQYKMALANYDSALKINARLQYPLFEMLIYGSMGNMYKLMKQYNKATDYYNKALSYSKDLKLKKDEADFLNDLSNIYLDSGDIAKGMEYAEQSLAITMQLHNDKQVCEINITLGKIYIAQKNYEQAVACLQNAYNIGSRLGLLEQKTECLLQLSKAFKLEHKPEAALEAYQNYIVSRDSLYSQEKAKEITRLEMQAGFDKRNFADSIKNVDARNVLNFQLQKQRIFTYSGFAGLFVLVLVSFLIFRNYSHEKKANRIIATEKEKSDELLLNILPEEVADELKAKGNVQPKQYDNVTVMFTDFVNFTAAGEKLGAERLVNELDNCFIAFDQIIAKYDIEKIKTVGDAYLVVSGLPNPIHNHAEDIVKAAIEIRDHMRQRRKEMGENTFEVRIGINTGPVIAGVVGMRKFAYDIWGDTVNVAARMEQSSVPGKVNISDVTYALVKDKFRFTYRGEIEAKNKGMMKMYFVE
jgi:class 3 adenylate cyclase/lipopolysaccharide biosynthesis regulator YciM